ncbi:bifunctional 3-(3-hydroxy-phenyl)propionate/3-hydroxycinnamic acid hydroxylase [Streptomyces sp. ADMS]|uniref:bifunctional 3-(3-hydroxy-phenyl)propionate/3-hydroxycinnamic acid hydroxylase MhpA n=1 Tax=Streptomyces sp. ADMS TaxID=3071415 RepID=UPI00296E8420|nr:bifunctional 3-(3-hydroxy-phenyl)propionate/3-hydroxycinnamic acid hydroxylase [Streptomyces sp. ADMS]MDW4909797.1 bifunctional 3-(3-hydroxy-phenyl)propionate/3-hydroxycinnamic acid hydroxylase [Streptomyces sp. ADMS]
MSAVSQVPVVVIGAGPVGVTAALLLARRGVRTVVLERHQDVYPLPRAVAMDDEVRRILQAAGVSEEFAARARPARGLRLLDARHRVIGEFRRSGHGRHGFPQTSMFDQPELERLLREALTRRPECELRGGVDVVGIDQSDDGPVRVTFRRDGTESPEYLEADLILGCDGAGSFTREVIGAVWEDLRFEECWTVIDVRTHLPVRSWEGVEQVCDPARAATFMRIGEDRYRWEFRLRDGEELDARRVRELIAPWLEASYDGDVEVIRQAEYTFRARVADRWRRGHVFLLGDAAHLTPPFIGQGLGAGMRDAYNLTWKIGRVLQQGAEESLLDSYEEERKPHARHMIRLAVAMGWAMTGGHGRAVALRRSLASTASRIPAVREAACRDLSPALSRSTLIRRPARLGGRELAGTSCPQPWVSVDAGRIRLDDLLGDSFAVLSAVPAAPWLRAVAEAIGARIISADGLGDDHTLSAWLRGGRADAALLRPDRVVLDVVPAGADHFTDAAAWAPLLCTTRLHSPTEPLATTPLSRSTSR